LSCEGCSALLTPIPSCLPWPDRSYGCTIQYHFDTF